MLSLAVEELYFNMASRDGPSNPILSNVHMIARPGTLTGIMGPSGSGKTSLLNVLAGRTKQDIEPPEKAQDITRTYITGRIMLNGHSVTGRQTREYSKYVMQRDELLGYLTVMETIQFGAYLKMRGRKKQEIEQKVASVINDLGLDSCRHVLVGDEEIKGISGGQRKRVSIALELLTDPPLLFLDEPTSGLDSSLAFDVIKVLSKLARQGKTVIATIHQPRPQIFQMLDNLLLLCEGKVVYHGPTSDVNAYLTSIGHPCPPEFATSDFLLDLLTPDNQKSELQGDQLHRPPSRLYSKRFSTLIPRTPNLMSPSFYRRGSDLSVPPVEPIAGRVRLSPEEMRAVPTKYCSSHWYKETIEALEAIAESPEQLFSPPKPVLREATKMYWVSVSILFQRFVKERLRKPSTFLVQFLTTIWMGFFCGFIWFQTPHPSDTNIDCTQYMTLLGALGWTVLEVSWNIFSMVVNLPDYRPLFNREVANKMYTSSAFFIAKNLSDLPFILSTAVIHVLPAYWLVGYGSNSLVTFYFFVSTMMNSFAGVGFMLMTSSFSATCTGSSLITTVGMVALSLNFGYFISVEAMPAFWRALKYVSWMYYSYTGIQLVIFRDSPQTTIACAGLDPSANPWNLVGLSFCLGIGFRLIGFLGIKYTNRRVGLES